MILHQGRQFRARPPEALTGICNIYKREAGLCIQNTALPHSGCPVSRLCHSGISNGAYWLYDNTEKSSHKFWYMTLDGFGKLFSAVYILQYATSDL